MEPGELAEAGRSTSGWCVEHPAVPGLPCARCGTFRCTGCLEEGRCAACRELEGRGAPRVGDAASFGRRLAARLIDLVGSQLAGLAGMVLAAVVLLVLEALGAQRAGWADRMKDAQLAIYLGALLGPLLGAAVATASCGASLGKLALGLRVVDLQGRRPGLGAGLVRELAFLLDGMFLGLVAYGSMQATPLRQRLGDRWARTAVVLRRAQLPALAASPGRLLLGLALGASVKMLAMAVALVLASR